MIVLFYITMEDLSICTMQHPKPADLAQYNRDLQVSVLQVAFYSFRIRKISLRVGLIYTQQQRPPENHIKLSLTKADREPGIEYFQHISDKPSWKQAEMRQGHFL